MGEPLKYIKLHDIEDLSLLDLSEYHFGEIEGFIVEQDPSFQTIMKFEDTDWIGFYHKDADGEKLELILDLQLLRFAVALIKENLRRQEGSL